MIIKRFLLVLASLMAFSANANLITNGDFATNNQTGWTLDEDGFTNPASENFNFSDGQAQITIDYTSVNGAFFGATMYQAIDTTVAADEGLRLSFDWSFFGEENGLPDSLDRDALFVIFRDSNNNLLNHLGDAGEFVTLQSVYGSGSVDVELDQSMLNRTDLTIEFVASAGFDLNFLGSTATFDNIALTTFSTGSGQTPDPVPEPNILLMLAPGLFVALRRKR